MVLGFHIVGVGAVDDPHGRGINTYAKHVCWRRRDGASWVEPARRRDGERIFYFGFRRYLGLRGRVEHRSPAVIYERYFIYISSTAPHNSNHRKKQSGDCSPLCFWKEKLLFSTSKNDSLILGIRIEFLECYTDLNLCAILLINCCRGYAAA